MSQQAGGLGSLSGILDPNTINMIQSGLPSNPGMASSPSMSVQQMMMMNSPVQGTGIASLQPYGVGAFY